MLSDPETYRTAQEELASGETLLWAGQSNPMREMSKTFGVWLFAIPWTAFSAIWVKRASGWGGEPNHLHGGESADFVFLLFWVSILLIGLAMVGVPFWTYFQSRRTVYAITNQRVVVIVKGRSRTIESYSSHNLGSIKRTERPDGSGDLTFAQKAYVDEGTTIAKDINFASIPQVKSVETLLRNTFRKE